MTGPDRSGSIADAGQAVGRAGDIEVDNETLLRSPDSVDAGALDAGTATASRSRARSPVSPTEPPLGGHVAKARSAR